MIALANLKQSGTIQDYYKSFIRLAHLVEETAKNLISIFLAGLREDLRAQVKMSKPLTMISAYRNAYARETIAATERKVSQDILPQEFYNPYESACCIWEQNNRGKRERLYCKTNSKKA